MGPSAVRRRTHEMIFITKYGKDGYRVKISGDDRELLIDCLFYYWEFKTKLQTKKAAIKFRDEQLKRLEDQRIYSLDWSPNVLYFIRGLCLSKKKQNIQIKIPTSHGERKKTSYTINTHGLRKAFDKTIAVLERDRRKSKYPEWVIEKSWEMVKAAYKKDEKCQKDLK